MKKILVTGGAGFIGGNYLHIMVNKYPNDQFVCIDALTYAGNIDIINAIGGVNVYSEYEFTSRIGGYHFKKGYNQMNGKQALGFARERYSFNEGDRMRGQNQQAVINAMIKKVCSSSTILTKFDALLDSLKGSFQTNIEYTKIIEIVRMQISDGSEWKISSISVDGSGSMERTYSMGKTLLSVLIPYAGSVNQAEAMIKDVLAGNMLEEGNIDISGYNDYLVVSRGVYEKEEPEEEETEEVIPEEVPDDNEEQENTDNSTENEEGNEENTENNNGGTGNDSTNTEDPETGDSTNSGTEIEDNKENSGNTGDSNETENNDNTSTDNGNSGTDTENENNTGNSSETDNGSTSNENPSESVSPVPQ